MISLRGHARNLKRRWRNYRKPSTPGLQILLYHRVLHAKEVDFLSKLGMVHTTTDNFEAHLKWLKQQRYNVISFERLAEIQLDGRPVPPKTIMITFDDGTVDHYCNAAPLLRKYGLPATFFPIKACSSGAELFWQAEFYWYLNELGLDRVSAILKDIPRLPSYVLDEEQIPDFKAIQRNIAFEFKYLFPPDTKKQGLCRLREERVMPDDVVSFMRQRYMTLGHIRELIRDGFEIGSHGIHHYPFVSLRQEEKLLEVESSWIEELMPRGKMVFSLPFGSYCRTDLELLADYDFVLTTESKVHRYLGPGNVLGRFALLDEPVRRFSELLVC